MSWDDNPPHEKFGRLRCCNQHCKLRDKPISCARGSWFDTCRIPVNTAIVIIYSFARGWTYEQTINESHLTTTTLSRDTIADWFSHLREVCVVALEKKGQSEGPMGGAGVVIEIDESLIGKQKSHVGRVPEGTWIFGMYNRNTKELRMVRCPGNKRNKATFIPIIKANIKPGTKIISDQWGVYWDNKNSRSHLILLGYQHETVNHSVNFVDPNTGANTQTMECYWRHMKTVMRRGE
jgi:ISXO2 transposase-like protein